MTNLELHDNDIMMLDELTWNKHEDLFKMIQKPRIPYEKRESFWCMVTIERELAVKHYERRLYTTFNMLSDVGGLSGFLAALFITIS